MEAVIDRNDDYGGASVVCVFCGGGRARGTLDNRACEDEDTDGRPVGLVKCFYRVGVFGDDDDPHSRLEAEGTVGLEEAGR